jgi:alkylation response protein AidB-like acyl-CoA dehydrogenase
MALGESKSELAGSIALAERRREATAGARAMASGLRARVPRTEADRCLPEETIEELLESGLFGIVKPKVFGGAELGLAALVDVTAELAAACGSTGWVYGVLAGHSWLINLFPVEAQREVFDNPRALTATVFRLGGTVTPVDGGYRLVDGVGRFCSGIDYASWVIVGNAVITDDGPPEPRFFIVPREDIKIIDDWHTVGMRGTGSRSIEISDALIPAHRSVRLDELSAGNSPGSELHTAPLYRMPFQLVAPFSIIGAPLGIAHGAIAEFSASFERWLADSSDVELPPEAATLGRLAHAAADVDAAHALVREDAKRIDEMLDPDGLDAIQRARLPRNWAYAAQTARRAVGRIFEAAGGSAVYEASALQRMWRDANAAAQHYAFLWDNAMVDYGRVVMGLAPRELIRRKR